MSQAATSSNKQAKATAASPLVPPDERFWQRYSPHAEFPLSSAGSLAIHLLVFGGLALIAWLGILLFSHSSRSLPVEAVRLVGGGGGNPRGSGDGPNNGAPVEAGPQTQEGPTEDVPPKDTEAPRLNVKPGPQVQPKFDENSTRFLQQAETDTAQVFRQLSDTNKRIRIPDRKPSGTSGYGKGGKGSGGGSGDGQGTGIGSGRGEGQGNLTQREKRMIRWVMGFNPRNANDYLGQLQGLGAIIAVPVRPNADVNKPDDYRLIRDLSARPPKLLKEDLSKLNRIYWYDNDPRSAALVMGVLGLNLQPDHFIAFMPEELEQKLFDLEQSYLRKHYPGRGEDDITATKFDINQRGGKYEPSVREVKVKK